MEWKLLPPDHEPQQWPHELRVQPGSSDQHHWLVVEAEWDEPDTEDRWMAWFEHPEECRVRGPYGEPACGVAHEEDNVGISDAVGGIPHSGGRWRVRHHVEKITIPMVGTEYDTWIEFIDQPHVP